MKSQARKGFDVVIASDFRYSGGTSASVVEEIKAQHRAGLRTGLYHIPSPSLGTSGQFNYKILGCIQAGYAKLLSPEQSFETEILILRQPRVFEELPAQRPRGKTRKVVMVVNQVPRDQADSKPYYDLAVVAQNVHATFGEDVIWAPIGPLVRERLVSEGVPLQFSDYYWYNVIDIHEWRADRSRFVSTRPVIGRHSRPDKKKWPADADELLQLYPDNKDVLVRIMGGAEVPIRVLGHLPQEWEVFDFNQISPKRFVGMLDFYVYFTHPEMVEAFGRSILEAMASGAVAILPHTFENLFTDSAVYCTPSDVAGTVRHFYQDREAYVKQSNRALKFVAENFSYESHIRRVLALMGESHQASEFEVRVHRRKEKRVLFLGTNGAGLGHLTRLMAMARRAPDDIEPLFMTLSQGMPIVKREGFFAEYMPSRGYLDVPAKQWNEHFFRRLLEVVRTYDPIVIVFDGTLPYKGLVDTHREESHRGYVWCRRAMWQPGKGSRNMERGSFFDMVIEPGEFAADDDEGITVCDRMNATCVDPIVFLDEEELLDREEARREMGLSGEHVSILVQLGAGNIDDISSPVSMIAKRFAREDRTDVAVLTSVIADQDLDFPAGIRTVRAYPVSRYYRAFDVVVSAAGYNSYHELLGFGIPSIFVPNLQTSLDSQVTRARYVEKVGAGICLDVVDEERVDVAVRRMLDDEVREEMRIQARSRFAGRNGAREAMIAIAELARKIESEPEIIR
jgi:UDP:flavonoid glycosyltransferase YjiC (YdhE family)/glycosyltransferase involved in cell wall biosynthesis